MLQTGARHAGNFQRRDGFTRIGTHRLRKRISRQICSIVCVWLTVGPALEARTAATACGTERGNAWQAVALRRLAERRLAKERTLRAVAAERQARAEDAGEIAVMDDAGGVIARANQFRMSNRSLTFTPAEAGAAGYRYALGEAGYDAEAAAAGTLLDGLGDDDARLVDLPFEFPFFGQGWRQAWVHSDGNVTFGMPEAASASRSLGRLAAGPARIAPLFSDLDPTRGGEIRVWPGGDRVVVTWAGVPQYQDLGTGPRQTFQLTLWTDGRIRFSFGAITSFEGVVGLAPGNLQGAAEVVSFLEPAGRAFEATVAERFGTTDGIDVVRVAQRFYETHEDAYDYIVIFNTAGVAAGAGSLAYETTVRSTREGIGDTPTDNGAAYGSGYRLQAVLNMGPLRQYPRDPYARVGSRGLITGDTTMTLLGHETGHLFLALASVRDPQNPSARPMLGTQLAHWSFNFNSEASLLEGNRIQDNGPGLVNRFLTVGTVEGYSPLDQYLMGFRAPYEVPPAFLVTGSNRPAASFPQVGIAIRGERQDITVDDIVAAEGRRVPDATVAQRLFRFAFVMVTPGGAAASADELAQLETYRAEFERFYQKATGERGWADATLRKMLRVSLWPAGGAVAGEETVARVSLAAPAAEDMAVQVFRGPSVEAPEQVVIPAGASSAEVRLRPVAAGATDLFFAPSDGRYETVHVKLDVKASRADLQLTEYYREPGLLVLRVTDANKLGYSNVTVRVEGLEEAARSDLAGLVWLHWNGEVVNAEIEGAPGTRLTVKE